MKNGCSTSAPLGEDKLSESSSEEQQQRPEERGPAVLQPDCRGRQVEKQQKFRASDWVDEWAESR